MQRHPQYETGALPLLNNVNIAYRDDTSYPRIVTIQHLLRVCRGQ